MISSSLLLLSIFCLPVDVYSQREYPYISFMGETLRNHSYVNLSLVGDPDRDGVEGIHCHTNLSTCCSEAQGGHRGDWYFPTGSRVPFSGDGDIFQVRRERVVFLRRRNNANMQTGVYRCDVPTSGGSQMRLAVYVGVYTTGGDLTMPEGMAVDTSSMYRIVLRCITTGGPATNVSWTKNCNPITEGTNSEVDNTVTSHYTHNLTIRRLQNTLDAVYTCSVSNNKPSRVSAVYPAEVIPADSCETYPYINKQARHDCASVLANIVQFLTVTAIKIIPASATTVMVTWSSRRYLSTSLQYTSYFSATGAVMSQSEQVLPLGVTTTDVSLDDEIDGYKHNFTLHYVICDIIPTPTTTVSFTFDKTHFQIQFWPIDYCLDWKLHKTNHIESQLRSRLADVIRERCTTCYTFSPAFLREGHFLCHKNPTTVTYRSTLINPFVTTTSANLVEIIQNWVTTRPILKLDGLIVRVSPNCPTCIPTLGADECADEAPSNAMIARTLSVCTVRTLGQDICTR